jgi:pimeloyl-ACP methyl ester carboxylesterase
MPEAPVLVGHSMGALIVQLLVARGLGVAGVAIDSAPPAGVFTPKWSFLKSNWPMISPFASADQPRLIPLDAFRYAFANTLPSDAQQALYDRYVVPESRRIPRQSLTSAAHIGFAAPHSPLLFIAGGSDHIIPASLNRANARRYTDSGSITDFRVFDGRDHLTIVEPGWEEVADFTLKWLEQTVPSPAVGLPS